MRVPSMEDRAVRHRAIVVCGGRRRLWRQTCGSGFSPRAVRDRDREDAGFSSPAISWRGAHARPARNAAAVRVEEFLMQMHSLSFDVSHTLAGGLVLISFMMLYQDRLYSLLNVFALHALVLALSVAWQAYIQDAPHLYVTAVIALVVKAIVIPVSLHRIVKQLGIHRTIETVVGIGPTMLAGMGLVALSMVVMPKATAQADPPPRQDLPAALRLRRRVRARRLPGGATVNLSAFHPALDALDAVLVIPAVAAAVLVLL